MRGVLAIRETGLKYTDFLSSWGERDRDKRRRVQCGFLHATERRQQKEEKEQTLDSDRVVARDGNARRPIITMRERKDWKGNYIL